MDFAGWRQFLATRTERIPGWLHEEAALLTASLSELQLASGIVGPILEIGVFHGKYLSVLYRCAAPSEAVVGVDLFVGADRKEAVAEQVRGNIAAACGNASRLKLLIADSLELTPDVLRQRSGCTGFRLISIDGGHTRELVRHDLEVAVPLLREGGFLALDDAFNHTTPGVVEGIAEYFLCERPALAPFAHCYNKLFVTTPSHHARYLARTWEWLEGAQGLPTRERTLHWRRENQSVGFTPAMFGYEVVPFL